jgi:Tol biopolymer transport system component
MKEIISLLLILALGVGVEVAQADFTFGAPTNLGSTANSSSGEGVLRISADGLSLYFASTRPGGYGGLDIWVTTRATKADPWGTPMNLGPPVNSSADDYAPSISADGL